MRHILYRLRHDQTNEHLRYSLRSLANLPHGEVYVVGHAPAWLRNVVVIAPERRLGKHRALLADLYLACQRIPHRDVLLIDDDVYVMRPRLEVAPLNRGPLAQHMAARTDLYGLTLRSTYDYLQRLGIGEPLSYELHVPMPLDTEAAVAALAPALRGPPVQARSVYGNVVGVGGECIADVKVAATMQPPTDYLSSSPATWRHWRSVLADRFPTPSQYEDP